MGLYRVYLSTDKMGITLSIVFLWLCVFVLISHLALHHIDHKQANGCNRITVDYFYVPKLVFFFRKS